MLSGGQRSFWGFGEVFEKFREWEFQTRIAEEVPEGVSVVRFPSCFVLVLCEVRARPFPILVRGSSLSSARCLSRFGVFAFPHSARPGVWWPNARSSSFARLAKLFALFRTALELRRFAQRRGSHALAMGGVFEM